MKELMPVDNINAVEVFNNGGLDKLLIDIDKEARSHVPDLETDKGRKAIASIAAKVSKSKTYLDSMGKDLVSDWKAKSKAVDGERKKMRDTLDALKADVRKPLTDWEDAEKSRVEMHEDRISAMSDVGSHMAEHWLDEVYSVMQDNLKELNAVNTDEFEEYTDRASEVKEAAVSRATKAIAKRDAHIAEQAELDALRKEAALREAKERDEHIAKTAREAATREAEQKAKIESERVEAEKQKAIDAQKAAELRASNAEKQAKIDSENAVKAERERIEKEKAAEKLAAEKREANTKHKKKINNESVAAFVTAGLSETAAKKAVIAIAKNEIPNVSISY